MPSHMIFTIFSELLWRPRRRLLSIRYQRRRGSKRSGPGSCNFPTDSYKFL